VGQAGQTLHCECGRSIEAPTMSGLRELEQVAVVDSDEAADGRAEWSPLQGGLFVTGLVLTVIALGAAALVVVQWSRLDTRDRSAEQSASNAAIIDDLPIDESFSLWEEFLYDGLGQQEPPDYVVASRKADTYLKLMVVLLAAAAGGIGLAGFTARKLFLARQGRS
jgi:hypothetical protein